MDKQMEQEQVEQTTQVNEEVQPTQVEEKPKERTFTQEELNEIVERRLHKERQTINKKIGVDDLDSAINIVKAQKETEEKQKIQKGEFEEILKNKTQEWNKEKSNLETQLKDIKINKSLLSSASKNRAINPDQVVELLNKNIKLNESGNVEILDKNGLARYNSNGELLTTDELVQEFLTQNPHFVSATPSGSGSVSNVDRGELSSSFKIEDLDMSNPKDREKYAKWKQKRNSQPRVINS
tara:strand:- start:1546 stop:2262 length:717 start_codon:yes stop_codon:yes gene_type:complete